MTTRTDMMKRILKRRSKDKNTKRELARHIPDLWTYARLLSGDDVQAYTLLTVSINSALKEANDNHAFPLNYESLSRLMYRKLLTIHKERKVMQNFKSGQARPAGWVALIPAKATKDAAPHSIH